MQPKEINKMGLEKIVKCKKISGRVKTLPLFGCPCPT